MVLLGISKWFSGWFWFLTKLNSLPSKIWFPDHHVHKMIPTHFKYQQKKRRYPRKKETSQVPLQAQVSVYFPIDWVHLSFSDMSDSLKVSKHLKIRRKCSSSNYWFSGAALVLGMFRSRKFCFATPRFFVAKKNASVSIAHGKKATLSWFPVWTANVPWRCPSHQEMRSWWVASIRKNRKKHRKIKDRPKDRYNDTSKNGPTDRNDHFQQLYLGQLMNTEMDICNVYV